MIRGEFKILGEMYDQLVSEERHLRQIPWTQEELKVLTTLYDFVKDKDNHAHLRRISHPGETEDIMRYSDGTCVLMRNGFRGVEKHEFSDYYAMVKALDKIYKATGELAQKQSPTGSDSPYGLSPGGQGNKLPT